MAKKSKKSKSSQSEGEKSPRTINVRDNPSSSLISDLENGVAGRASPSMVTSSPQVIKNKFKLKRSYIQIHINFVDKKKDFKKMEISYNIDYKGQIKPDRTTYVVVALIVRNNSVLYDNLLTILNKVKYYHYDYKRKLKTKYYYDIELILNLWHIRFQKIIRIMIDNKIMNFFIQASEDDLVRIREEARTLEEIEDDDLLNNTDEEAEKDDVIEVTAGSDRSSNASGMSNQLENTIFVPDASHVMAGGSSRPPPIIQIGNILRSTRTASRRSTMSIVDEIDSTGDRQQKEKELPETSKTKSGEANKTKSGGKKEPTASSKKGKQAAKRPATDSGQAPKVKHRKTYAEVASEGARMCEIRTISGQEMSQQDYNKVIIKLMYALMEYQMKAAVKNKRNTWIIVGSGLSRSAVWLGAGSDECVDFLRISVPLIRLDENVDAQMYQFYGPGERPWRLIRWRVPYMWTTVPVDDLQRMVYMCNTELWVKIERSDGNRTDPVWKIKKRIHDDRDVTPEDGSGFVSFLIEVEEDMMPILIEKCLGVLRIGATEGRLTGSGIVTAVREFLGVGNDEQDNDQQVEGNDQQDGDGQKDGDDDDKEKDKNEDMDTDNEDDN